MKFSIIIASLNAEALIQRAISSVLSQDYTNYEIIVQDGGSTDQTVNILKQFTSNVNWVSEPDAGIYDAWNKALDRVTGDWALFLGADDLLLDKAVLSKCWKHLTRLPPEVWFAYGTLILGEAGQPSMVVARSLLNAYHHFFVDLGLPFPATFTRVPVLKKHRFDASFRIVGDFDFAARLISPSNVARLPVEISYMEMGGISSNLQYQNILLQERLRVLRTRVAPKAQELLQACMELLEKEAFPG